MRRKFFREGRLVGNCNYIGSVAQVPSVTRMKIDTHAMNIMREIVVVNVESPVVDLAGNFNATTPARHQPQVAEHNK